MKTLYVVELYGAFLDSKGMVSNYDLDILERLRENGMDIVIATDRSWLECADTLKHEFDRLCRSILIKTHNGVDNILLNGAWTRKSPKCISLTSQYAIAEVYDTYGIKGEIQGITSWCATYVPRCFLNHHNDFETWNFETLVVECGTIKQCLNQMNQEHLHIIAFTAKGTYEELLPLKKKAIQLEDVRFTFYEDKSNDNYRICISSKKTSQGIAISKIKDKLSCDRVVCISDKMYDLSMFEAADVRVAMGNADEETKAAADIIIDSNDKSGLVKFLLEEYIKNNKYTGKE